VLCKFDTSRENEEEKNTVKTNLERALLARLSLSPKKSLSSHFAVVEVVGDVKRKRHTRRKNQPLCIYLRVVCFLLKLFEEKRVL